MSVSKIDFKIGDLHFQCEGENDWVNSQLDKVLEKAPDLLSKQSSSIAPPPVKSHSVQLSKGVETPTVKMTNSVASSTEQTTTAVVGGNRSRKRGRPSKQAAIEITSNHPLVGYLERHDALDNQVRRFLATATFLMSGGVEMLTTTMVATLLEESGLPKLSNASDCLNKNEKKGYCLKQGKMFVITQEGVRSIQEG
ncbi:hypothetical protein K5X82_15970 [Halosquirtibacter xylanolyticus]|uniref:hypothetical protein n=1 Tax=Halosquirtibacter xylanolyticus TaxID=3374599 RepID=UPI003748C96A|nr:hypothetical protein K5X82_15970 [Prolixibacteraceae bacterium]